LTSFITQHGLPLLFAAVAVESVGFPVPGETALIAFGVLASQGHYSIAVVIAVAAVAAIVGDNLGFWLIGRRGGHALIARYAWIERRTRRGIVRARAPDRPLRGSGGLLRPLRLGAPRDDRLGRRPGRDAWPKFLLWNALGGIVWATGSGCSRITEARRSPTQ
jgi:membrane protein DedA with SNARE-associated domain